MEKKISVIIPVYGTEKYLEKCITSVLNQSYKNIEMILVNDCSPDGSQRIIDAYMEKYEHIKCVKLDKNGGLFHARLAGVDLARGDYIAFLDSDDYVAVDAYRSMIDKANSTQSDIVFGNIVIEWEADGRLETHIYNEPLCEILEGPQIVERYLEQEGYTFFWYAVWNKIFSKDVFDQARPYFDRITEHTIMAEDVAFCSVLLAMADRVSFVDYYTNYYLQSATSSTSRSTSQAKYIKNIKDMCRVMDFVQDFIYEYPGYGGCKDKFARFKEVFVLYWKSSISRAMFSKRKKKECLAILLKEAKFTAFPDHDRDAERSLTYGVDRSFIYSQSASFNDGYEQIVRQLSSDSTHRVLFPFEDILFQKNMMHEEELFWFLEQTYKDVCPKGSAEDDMALRKSCEKLDTYMTIDDIYQEMNALGVDHNVCETLKRQEIRLLKQLYSRRESVKQLFDLAVYLGKYVVVKVDNHLNETIAKEMLLEHGYKGYHSIYFDHEGARSINDAESFMVCLHSTENEEENEGEDHQIVIAYPRSISVLFNKCELFDYFKKSHQSEQDFFSNILNKSCVMNAANIYFDNPFRPFDKKTDFNRDAYLMGLFPIAMFIMNLTRWVMDDDRHNEIVVDKSNHLFMETLERSLHLIDHRKNGREIDLTRLEIIPKQEEGSRQTAFFGIKNNPISQALATDQLYVYGDTEEKTSHSDSLYLFQDSSLPTIVAYLIGSLDDERQHYYSEKLINANIKKGVLDFTNRMSFVYSSYLMDMQADHQSMAYPFEYLLHHSKFKDIGLFDYCSLYFEKNNGYEEMSVFNYWMQVNISKADIISGKVDLGGRGFGYYPFLQKKSTAVKVLFFLFFDKETLFEKLKIRFGSNKRAHRFLNIIERLIMKKKDGNGECHEEV